VVRSIRSRYCAHGSRVIQELNLFREGTGPSERGPEAQQCTAIAILNYHYGPNRAARV